MPPSPLAPTPSETLLRRWGRRGVSIPLMFLMAGLLVVCAPALIPLALVVDALRARLGRAPLFRAYVYFLGFCLCEVVGLLGAGGIWLFTLGGRLGGEVGFRRRNTALQHWWTGAVLELGRRVFGFRVQAEGLPLAGEGPYLLLVRHQSTVDTVLASSLIANPQGLEIRCVLKRELLWDPCLDVVGQRLPNAFVARSGHGSEGDITAISQLPLGMGPGSILILFPEGTRFSKAKAQRRLQGLSARGAHALYDLGAQMSHVLPPKTLGLKVLLEAGRSALGAPGLDVIFLAHCGMEGVSRFSDFLSGGLIGADIRVKLWRVSAQDIPLEGLELWLFEQWLEVDRWIKAQD